MDSAKTWNSSEAPLELVVDPLQQSSREIVNGNIKPQHKNVNFVSMFIKVNILFILRIIIANILKF